MFLFLLFVNALFFVLYGSQCFISQFMVDEFRRFGMSDAMRKLTGVLQFMGAGGLLIGLYVSVIGFLAAAGLSMMMLFAFGVRIWIKDGILASLPSLIFMGMNLFLAVEFLKLLLLV